MAYMLGKRLIALSFLLVAFFWETLSHFSIKGGFCANCYQDESQNFLLLAPPLLMIWLFRHHLFVSITPRGEITKTDKSSD